MAYNRYNRQHYGGWSSRPAYGDRADSTGIQGTSRREGLNSYRSPSNQDQWDCESEDGSNSSGVLSNTSRTTMDAKLSNDRELCMKTLSVDQKKFILYLRENDFGRFIRILEKSKNFSNNKIIIPEGLLEEFIAILNDFSYKALDKKGYIEQTQGRYSDILAKKTLKQHSKSIFIELRENTMGKFVKIISLLRQNRQHIIMPAAGIFALTSVIETMLQESAVKGREDRSEGRYSMSPDRSEGVLSPSSVLAKNSIVPQEVLGNAKLEPVGNLFISSDVYFEVVYSAEQELKLKITDRSANTSLLIPHKNWTSCVKALQVLMERHPLPADRNDWI